MIRTSSRPQRTNRGRSRPASRNLISIDPGWAIQNAKRYVLPKELSFGVFFSYHR
jgi:hypothetical protein